MEKIFWEIQAQLNTKLDLKEIRCEIVEHICVPMERTECLPM